MQLLRNQAGLWDHLATAACMTSQRAGRPEPSRPVFSSGALDGQEQDPATIDEAWRLTAQGLAIQILALNCHWPGILGLHDFTHAEKPTWQGSMGSCKVANGTVAQP